MTTTVMRRYFSQLAADLQVGDVLSINAPMLAFVTALDFGTVASK
jgi:hypothetical protein